MYVNEDELFQALKNKKDIDKKDSIGNTLLMGCAENGDIDNVKKLITAGADIQLINSHGDSALVLALKSGQIKTAEYLCEKGAKILNLSNSDLFDIFDKNPESIKILKKSEFNLNNKDKYGYSPLIDAIYNNRNNIAKLLIKNDVDCNCTFKDGNDNELSALELALFKKQSEIATLLITHGADIHHYCTTGSNSFLIAAQSGDNKNLQLLMDKGISVDITGKKNYEGQTALMSAAYSNHLDTIKFLISCGANINTTRNTGLTALMVASQAGSEKIVEYLIKNGADINLITNEGADAFICATQYGNVPCAALLLEAGADINHMDKDGTALHNATREGKYDSVKFLLEKGINYKLKNPAGETALDIAKKKDNKRIISLLQNAKGNATNSISNKTNSIYLDTDFLVALVSVTKIICNFSSDILIETNKFQALLADFLPRGNQYLSLLKSFAKSKASVIIHEADSKEDADRKTAVEAANEELVNIENINPENANNIIKLIVLTLGWDLLKL
ncbi:ankyrin repeat domain-containing protein [Treponema sp.]|uniref:ankyrin repeat domain-containing protein n=1 Tax=Treponema sp. TaxID=166 RepID=UPI002580F91F|nr:ankyrin repeat domain-containing protein [Treponema sp.]MBE6353374.1 hypothetical protein [Treponema sp.]